MKQVAKLALGVLAALAVVSRLPAEILPQANGGDAHIQSVRFDPLNVVGLHLVSGFATTIKFADDERIETVTVGDSAGWAVQVNHRADHLVVKPVGMPATTNLTVVTDQRTYNFTLYSGGNIDGVMPYVLSFTYPTPAPAAGSGAPVQVTLYRLRGDRAIWPTLISDDGSRTSIVWDADTALPAVYRSDQRGQKALVNLVMRDGTYLIEGAYNRLIFIRGKLEARADRIVDRKQP